MPTVKERTRDLRSQFRATLNLDLIPATVITRSGQIQDPLIPGNYWVSYQTSNGLSTTRSVRGPAKVLPLKPGTAVMLETFRGRLRIRELDTDRELAKGGDPQTDLQYEKQTSTPQGRFETLRLVPKSGLTVSLRSWNIIAGGIYREFSYPDIDLTSHVPSAGNMRYATIFVKSDFSTVEVVDSTARSTSDLPLDASDVNETIAAASVGSTAVWAVKLIGGQTDVSQDDIDADAKDLRQMVNELSNVAAPSADVVEFTQTATVTVANTTSETSLLGSGVGTKTLPASSLVAGRNIRIRASGFFSDTLTPTLRIKIKLGSTVILDTTAIALIGTISNNFWEVTADITCRTTGASGTVFGQGRFTYDNTTNTGASEGMVNTATTTIDTTASQAIDVTCQWGTASSSNTISCGNASIEVLN